MGCPVSDSCQKIILHLTTSIKELPSVSDHTISAAKNKKPEWVPNTMHGALCKLLVTFTPARQYSGPPASDICILYYHRSYLLNLPEVGNSQSCDLARDADWYLNTALFSFLTLTAPKRQASKEFLISSRTRSKLHT